jgi:hypothetical protein
LQTWNNIALSNRGLSWLMSLIQLGGEYWIGRRPSPSTFQKQPRRRKQGTEDLEGTDNAISGKPGLRGMDAWTLELLLPSVIQDEISCDPRLWMIEWHLRVAQAKESLAKIWNSLRIKSVLVKFKIDHTHSVREGNRSTERIKDSLKKARTHAMTYRAV